MLREFCEVEDCNFQKPALSVCEKSVFQHFENTHTWDESGRFIVPLPRKTNVTPLGESHLKAAKGFLILERSLAGKESYPKFIEAMQEYFEMRHAEPVPVTDVGKDCKDARSNQGI